MVGDEDANDFETLGHQIKTALIANRSCYAKRRKLSLQTTTTPPKRERIEKRGPRIRCAQGIMHPAV